MLNYPYLLSLLNYIMSSYNPPVENVPIFDSGLFSTTNTPDSGYLTKDEADKLYLQYPFAQGAETLANGTTATTQATSDNSTKVATTAFVKSVIPAVPSSNVYNYPQVWWGGNYYILGNSVPLPTAGQSVFINCPSISFTFPPASTPTGFSITLEISYQVIATENSSSIICKAVYNGYCLTTLQLSPANTADGYAGGINRYDIQNIGNMFSTQTITNGGGGSNSSFTPVSWNYTAQGNKNGFQLDFGSCGLSDGSVVAFSRSVRIVSSYPLHSNAVEGFSVPNANYAPQAYISPVNS